MGKVKKSTKKFQQKHLKSEISRRRRFQKRTKGKAVNGTAAGSEKAGSAFKDESKKKKNVEDLEVDELLEGDFLNSEEEGDVSDEGNISDELPSDMDSAESDEDDLGLDEHDDSDDEEDINTENAKAAEEDDSSDEDEDEGGDEAVTKDNKRLRAEIGKHKAQLERLKDKDPDFYKYLQQTNPELLGFGEGEDEDEEEEEEEGEDEEEEAVKDKKTRKTAKEEQEEEEEEQEEEEEEERPGPSGLDVTSSLVQQWCNRAKLQGSLGSMRRLVKAYHVAAHVGDTEEQVQSTLRISSSAVYNKLMLFMLNNADHVFLRLLSLDKKAVVTFDAIKSAPRWKKVEPLVKSYLGNTIHLMSQLTETGITSFLLRRLRPSVVFLTPYAKLQRRCLKQALSLFGGAEHAVRLQAFLLIRHMAMTLPAPAMDRCMIGIYQTFLSNAKFMSAAAAPHINFMGACIVELWGLDAGSAYQHTFQAIKRLAVVLRNALSMKTKEGYKEIYSWQTINCLELWARVLGAYAKTQLRVLVFPVAQLLITSARLVPNARYFPLRLRLVRALNRLAADADVHIPVAPIVLDVLNWAELHRTPTSGGGSTDLQLRLRASKTTLKSGKFQEEVVLQVVELLATHLSQAAYSVAFPELSHLPLLNLRKFIKTSPVEKFKRAVKGLVDAIERNVSWVGQKRSQVEFSPKHSTQVLEFLKDEKQKGQAPLHQYATQLQAKAQQRASLSSQEEVKLGKRKHADSDSDDDSDEEMTKKAKQKKQQSKRHEEEDESDLDDVDDDEDEEDDADEEEEDDVGDGMKEEEQEEEEPVQKKKSKKDSKGTDGKKGEKAGADPPPEKPGKKKKAKIDIEKLAMEIPDVLKDFELSGSDEEDGDMDGVMDMDDDDDVIEGEESE